MLSVRSVQNKRKCPSDRQQKDDKQGQTGDRPREGPKQGAKKKQNAYYSRSQQGGGLSLKVVLPGVSA